MSTEERSVGAEDGTAVGASVVFNPGETRSGNSVGSGVIWDPVGGGLPSIPSPPSSTVDVGSGVGSNVSSDVGSGVCSGVCSDVGSGSGTGGGDGTEGVGGDGSGSSTSNGARVMKFRKPVGDAVSMPIWKAVGDTVGDIEGKSVSSR